MKLTENLDSDSQYIQYIYLQKLPNDLHVVAMDLPGHGDSDVPPDEEDLSFYSQIKRIKQVYVKSLENY